jgi:hypothetical protein
MVCPAPLFSSLAHGAGLWFVGISAFCAATLNTAPHIHAIPIAVRFISCS